MRLAVYAGDLDAGIARESAMGTVRKFVPANQLKVLMKTAWIPQWALSVNRMMLEKHVQRIRMALDRLPADHKVLKALKVDQLVPAQDKDYDAVRNALEGRG